MQPRENFKNFIDPVITSSDLCKKSLNELQVNFKSFFAKNLPGALLKDWGNFSDIEFMQIEQDAAAATEIRRFHFQNYSCFPFSGRTQVVHFASLIFAVAAAVRLSSSLWVEEDECRSERTNGARFMHAISHSFLSFLQLSLATEGHRKRKGKYFTSVQKMPDVHSKQVSKAHKTRPTFLRFQLAKTKNWRAKLSLIG